MYDSAQRPGMVALPKLELQGVLIPPNVGPGDGTWVLCKSSMNSTSEPSL